MAPLGEAAHCSWHWQTRAMAGQVPSPRAGKGANEPCSSVHRARFVAEQDVCVCVSNRGRFDKHGPYEYNWKHYSCTTATAVHSHPTPPGL